MAGNTKKTTRKNNHIPVKKTSKQINTRKKPYYIVCIGASAGGLNAVSELVSQLPASLDAAVFVVLHLSKSSIAEILAGRIRQYTQLPCTIARNNATILPGHIYLAPPDSHLLVKQEKIIIGKGPAENRFRPSVDVLFRSAAASYGERTIGIVLTGFLNDGTSGMWAIHESGGHCIVQDPHEAEYPDMPLSVLEIMEVDHVVPIRKMAGIISNIISTEEIKGIVPPVNIIMESNLSEKAATAIANVQTLGEKTIYACPDCGGGLWKVKNGHVHHYRCHIGHSYSENDLAIKQSDHIEQTLWVAVRMMEERKILLTKMGGQNKKKGLDKISNSYLEQAEHLNIHIEKMKELLFAIHKD